MEQFYDAYDAAQAAAVAETWKAYADSLIGYTGKEDAETLNRRITAAYARMFRNDSKRFQWAGIAAFASKKVGEGICRTDRTIPLPLVSVHRKELRLLLSEGNLAVYRDLYWQFLLFRSQNGMSIIEQLYKQGAITRQMYDAWKLISQGNFAAGNRAILKYEQQMVLQAIYVKHPAGVLLLNKGLQIECMSPVPGGRSFGEVVQERVQDVSNFTQRWEWIEQMLKDWENYQTNHNNELQQLLDEFLEYEYNPDEDK